MTTPLVVAVAVVLAVAVAASVVLWRRRSSRIRARSTLEGIDGLLATGDVSAASDAAIAALATRSDLELRVRLRQRLARVLVGKEEYEAASRICAEAAAEAPGDDLRAAALVERARCLAAAGDLEGVEKNLARAGGSARSPQVRVELELVAADMALFAGRLDAAERSLAAAFRDAERAGLTPEVALGHARLQLERGNFRQAIAEISRVLEQLPGDDLQALALATLARALLEQEHPDTVGADHALSRAGIIVHQPGQAAVISACQALLQAHFKNFDEAVSEATRAPGLTCSRRYRAEASCRAGDALRLAGRFLEARSAYQNALADYPNMTEALWGLGACAQAFGLFEVAETYYTFCTESAPGHFLAVRAEHELGQ